MTPAVWADVFVLYAAAAAWVVLSSVAVRLLAGAPVRELVRTRGYELPAVRLVFHAAHAFAWLGCLAAAGLAVRHGWAYSETSAPAHGVVALVAVGSAVAAGLLAALVHAALIRIPDNRPPTVAVTGVRTTEGINRRRLAGLGREQFPQMLAYGHTAGLSVRGGLIAAAVVVAGFAAVAATDWGREHGLQAAGLDAVRVVRAELPPVPPAFAVVAGVSAGLGLVLLLTHNAAYTLLRFPTTLPVGAGLSATMWAAAATLNLADGPLGLLAAGLGVLFAVRWADDLGRAARFRRTRQVTEPIARAVAAAVPGLGSLKHRPDCRIDPLDEPELRERIRQGCRNVEAADPLVTRNLGRFLSLVRIEYEQFAAAGLRYLTVRRYVSLGFGGGTTRPLQYPVVPVWDEARFPIHPPRGFADWIDPLGLGWEWDVVSVCGPCGGSGRVACGGCGGSGRVQRSETRTEYQNGQSVSVTVYHTETCGGCGGSGRVTCGRCGGCGKVVEPQTLNTQWQRLQPTATAPAVRLPELMEDAEERVYYRVPLVEDRRPLVMLPQHDGLTAELEDELNEAVPALAPHLPGFAAEVERLHDGFVYRADFQVTGFWVLRIGFRRLPGKVGWFFGRRPEFHFPALPLGWGQVGAVLFVLPLAVLAGLAAAVLAGAWLSKVLPAVP
jgi:hypothetical protein